jgi:hypothetical protein
MAYLHGISAWQSLKKESVANPLVSGNFLLFKKTFKNNLNKKTIVFLFKSFLKTQFGNVNTIQKFYQ